MYTGHMRDGASYNVYKRLPHHTIFSLPLAHPRDTPLFFSVEFFTPLEPRYLLPGVQKGGGRFACAGELYKTCPYGHVSLTYTYKRSNGNRSEIVGRLDQH